MSKTHDLKCDHEPFQALWNSDKYHEVRKNDRDYNVGDYLYLRELDKAGVETNRRINAWVSYITPGGSYGLPKDICVMSIIVSRRYEAHECDDPDMPF